MIGNHAHGDIGGFVFPIDNISKHPDSGEKRSKQIGIVIGVFALQYRADTLESHTGIHMNRRQ